MPFKFKLSKRLALIKASLAASVVLALACERDLTDPQPSRIPLTQVVTSLDLTPLPVASVSASGDDGNIPQNTLDNNLATRWSASGDRQWIRYDLGAVMAIGAVNIAWYRGTEWARDGMGVRVRHRSVARQPHLGPGLHRPKQRTDPPARALRFPGGPGPLRPDRRPRPVERHDPAQPLEQHYRNRDLRKRRGDDKTRASGLGRRGGR